MITTEVAFIHVSEGWSDWDNNNGVPLQTHISNYQ